MAGPSAGWPRVGRIKTWSPEWPKAMGVSILRPDHLSEVLPITFSERTSNRANKLNGRKPDGAFTCTPIRKRCRPMASSCTSTKSRMSRKTASITTAREAGARFAFTSKGFGLAGRSLLYRTATSLSRVVCSTIFVRKAKRDSRLSICWWRATAAKASCAGRRICISRETASIHPTRSRSTSRMIQSPTRFMCWPNSTVPTSIALKASSLATPAT